MGWPKKRPLATVGQKVPRISQGSVAMRLIRGRIFSHELTLITNLLLNVEGEGLFLNRLSIGQCYRQ